MKCCLKSDAISLNLLHFCHYQRVFKILMRRHLMTTYFVFKVIALHRVLVLQLLLLLQFMTVIVSMASRHFIVSCLIISYLILFYSILILILPTKIIFQHVYHLLLLYNQYCSHVPCCTVRYVTYGNINNVLMQYCQRLIWYSGMSLRFQLRVIDES